MYIILGYDIAVTNKKHKHIKKICSRYLFNIQKSLFHGEITAKNYMLLMAELQSIIDFDSDSIAVFELQNKRNVNLNMVCGNAKTDNFF